MESRPPGLDVALRPLEATTTETCRYKHVAAERLRADIRMIAALVTARLDRLEATLREEIWRAHDSLAGLIRLAYTDLDRRVTALERRPRDAA